MVSVNISLVCWAEDSKHILEQIISDNGESDIKSIFLFYLKRYLFLFPNTTMVNPVCYDIKLLGSFLWAHCDLSTTAALSQDHGTLCSLRSHGKLTQGTQEGVLGHHSVLLYHSQAELKQIKLHSAFLLTCNFISKHLLVVLFRQCW